MDLLFSTISTVTSFLGNASSHTQDAVKSVQWTELPGDAQRFFSRVAGNGTNFISLRWDDLPQTTKAWIKAHPYQTAFYVAHGVVIVAPTPVTAPLIGAAGLATASPVAGKQAVEDHASTSPPCPPRFSTASCSSEQSLDTEMRYLRTSSVLD
ncbi:hypothetical protein SLS55_002671 [Diplodia seriata]|uniref:Uncharacterized protein n=1 Tax=Diplodia seriata TaxID=420778 RepID=A0ABR3CSV2_9PEZI